MGRTCANSCPSTHSFRSRHFEGLNSCPLLVALDSNAYVVMHVCSFSSFSSRQPSSSPARSRSLSPHSPLVEKATPTPAGGAERKAGEGSGVLGGKVQGRGGEAMPVEKQNALLKVTEAHLAILPDEDGDT